MVALRASVGLLGDGGDQFHDFTNLLATFAKLDNGIGALSGFNGLVGNAGGLLHVLRDVIH